MQIRKIFSALLALALMLGGTALGEQTDYEARIAELEEQVEQLSAELEAAQAQLQAYEEQNYVVTFDGGVVTLDEARKQYDYVVSMYQSYGYSIAGYEDYLRQDILKSLAQKEIVSLKGHEMGLDQFDEEAMAAYETEARTAYETNLKSAMTYVAQEEDLDEDDLPQAAEAYLEEAGYSYDQVLEALLATHVQEAVYAAVTEGVEVAEEDVQAAYDTAVSADEASYSEDARAYENARASATPVYWNPDGYRTVKHVLVKFNDEQAARYSDLTKLISDLEAQIAAAAEDGDAEESAEGEELDAVTLEDQLAGAIEELDALYQELMPRAEEVISLFEGGEDIDALIAEYGEDPGMQREPGMTQGYYVSERSQLWEKAFTEGAMSIENPGEISAPVHGSNGIHIIYYAADVPAGAVAFDSVHEEFEAAALEEKRTAAYDEQVAAWMEELHVEYFMDRFR